MKEVVTVEKLKKTVAMSIKEEKEERGGSSEWDDIFLEPLLLESCEVTLEFINTAEKQEFEVVSCYFSALVRKFNSKALLNAILARYAVFYGDDIDTEIYRYDIDGLENCLKKT